MTDWPLELRALVDSYAIAIDDGDEEMFLAVFSPDALVRVMPERPRHPAVEFSGTDDLRRLCRAVATACERTFHFVGNHVAEVDGDRATAVTYCTAHHVCGTGGGARLDEVMVVRYDDRMARFDEGWRITERVAHRLWSFAVPVASRALGTDHALAAVLGGDR